MVKNIHALLDGYLIGHARLKPSINILRGEPPEWGVSIRIDPRSLSIEVVLPQYLCAYFLFPVGVEIFDVSVCLQSLNCNLISIDVWKLNFAGLFDLPSEEAAQWWSPEDGVEPDSCLLKLTPQKYQLKLLADKPVCQETPYFYVHGNVCSGLVCIKDFQLDVVHPRVSCALDAPSKGMLTLSSCEDFSKFSSRLVAGFMLAHGRMLPLVLEVSGVNVVLCGLPKSGSQNSLPLLSHFKTEGAAALLRKVVHGFCNLEASEFAHAFLALRFFLLGKTADVPVDVRFLQLMVCVEAMDEVRDLNEKTTAALLSISTEAAKFLNCMRNKLIHGAGGYRDAFAQVVKEDFHGYLPKLGLGFDGVVVSQNELQFAQLWLRLCERLDAFWCGYLKVEPELLVHRSTWADIELLPAVDVASLADAAIAYKQEKKAKEDKVQRKHAEKDNLTAVMQENQRLKDEIRKLRCQSQLHKMTRI